MKTSPVVAEVLKHFTTSTEVPAELKNLLLAAMSKSRKMTEALLKTEQDGCQNNQLPANHKEEDYRISGVCYGAKQVRQRPKYPRMEKDDGEMREEGNDNGEQPPGDININVEGKVIEKCQKYYVQFRKRTGGMCVLWCPHGIAVGFHIIPKAEGRNDVFSAIFTRWKKAPKVVVYDFACQLFVYNIRREPSYWLDTVHVIDTFHFRDHNKCSQAFNMLTFAKADPIMETIRDTAAEVGNSGLARIRKSIKYMSQANAMMLTKIYLEIHNRRKIRELNKLYFTGDVFKPPSITFSNASRTSPGCSELSPVISLDENSHVHIQAN